MAIFFSLWLGGGLAILLFLGIVELVIPRMFPGWESIKNFGRLVSTAGLFFFSAFTVYLLYWLNTYFTKRDD